MSGRNFLTLLVDEYEAKLISVVLTDFKLVIKDLARKISANYDKTDRAYPIINLTKVSDDDLTNAINTINRLNRELETPT